MPYFHTLDEGRVHFWRRRCIKCNKKWPVKVLFSRKVPKDMYFEAKHLKLEKGSTKYAQWADKFPASAFVASRLPNWPRWARIGIALLFIFIAVLVVYLWPKGG